MGLPVPINLVMLAACHMYKHICIYQFMVGSSIAATAFTIINFIMELQFIYTMIAVWDCLECCVGLLAYALLQLLYLCC